MATGEEIGLESLVFDYIDEFKFLLFPGKWSNIFLDYSKNEIMVLLFLYRKNKANMTELSEYICAPLNTATGVISRLEKKKMVTRIRGDEDRRIVNIVLTHSAEEFLNEEKKLFLFYFNEIHKSLTEDEKNVALSIANKIVNVLRKGQNKDTVSDNTNKRVKRIIIE